MPWEMCLVRGPPHPFFNLLVTLTKHWSQSGPTCPKLLPRNDRPHPSQSSRVQPGLSPGREARLSAAAPTLLGLPLQVQAAQQPGGETKQNETTRTPFLCPPSSGLLSVSSCESLGMYFDYKSKKWVAVICPTPLTRGLLGLC